MPRTVTFEGDPAEYEVATTDDVMAMLDGNHIWVNAFSTLNPTDELAQEIGHTILRWLRQKENLIPKAMSDSEIAELADMSPSGRDVMTSLAKLTPHLYVRVNAS